MDAAERNGGILERARRRKLIAAGAVALLATIVLVFRDGGQGGGSRLATAIPGDTGPALTVEVLNGTDVSGAAREISRKLRGRGVDVVYFGSTGERLDSTVIVVRRGDSAAIVPLRRALGAGRIRVELDPQRLLDASVLIGRDLATPFERHP